MISSEKKNKKSNLMWCIFLKGVTWTEEIVLRGMGQFFKYFRKEGVM